MSEGLTMLPVKQKDITDRIQKYGFKKSEFSFTPTGEESFELVYKPTTHYIFKVDHNLNYSGVPGSKGRHQFNAHTSGWPGVLSALESWLSYVKENVDAGNPWEEIVADKKISDEAFGNYNEFLNKEQQQEFASKLDLMIEHFKSLQLATGRMEADIAHMKEVSDKISKKDLLLLFVGTITTYVMNGVIPQEKLNEVWHYIINLFSISHKFLAQ